MDYYQSKDYISDYQGVAPSLHLASMRLSIYELDIAVTTFVLTFISFFLVSSWEVLPSSSYLDSVLVHMQSTITSWVFICSSHPEGYVGTTQFGPSSQNTLLSSFFFRGNKKAQWGYLFNFKIKSEFPHKIYERGVTTHFQELD